MKDKNNGNGIFDGTLIADIVEFAQAGNFDSLELKPLEDGETVIGEMTDIEKAVFAMFDQKRSEIMTTCRACADTEADRASVKCRRVSMLKKQCETLKELSWCLIQQRLNEFDTSLGIRHGFQIVRISDERAEALEGRLGGIGIIRIGLGSD